MLVAEYRAYALCWRGGLTGCLLLLLALAPGGAFGQGREKTGAGVGRSAGATEYEKTVITAARLTFDYERRIGVLEEKVHVVGKGVAIDADTMTLRFSGDNQVTNVFAVGNVRIRQADGFATCATARCDVVRGELILSGSPTLTRGQEQMKGDLITIFRDPVNKKAVRVSCYSTDSNRPSTLILGPGAKIDVRLTGDSGTR